MARSFAGMRRTMSSISAAFLSNTSYVTPRQRLQNELLSEVSAGTVSSSDQTALSSALDDIDSSLKADREANPGSGPPAPGQFQSKIADLIAGEVSKGTLTSDQASELQNIFAKTFGHHHGGPHGGRGAAGPPPVDGSDPTAASGDTGGQTSQLMNDFLKLIQDLQSSNSTAYSASGTNKASSSFSAMFLNVTA